MAFAKATKLESKGRVVLLGPAGCGKSETALRIAVGLNAGTIAAIDTEHGTLRKYSDRYDFDVDELDTFDPPEYVKRIAEAERARYGTLVIDSLTHAWAGAGGLLEQSDRQSSGDNKFTVWAKLTPKHNALIEAVHRARLHVVATMRTKMDYVIEENDKGKKVPRKVGMAPIQREGLEYEYDVVGEMDLDHTLRITKSRCPELDGRVFERPGSEVGVILAAWLRGDRRREPWEDAVALGDYYKGMKLSELSAHVLAKYIRELTEHIKRHPETKPDVRRTWTISIEHAERAFNELQRTAAPMLPPPTASDSYDNADPQPETEAPPDDDDIPF